MVILGLGSNKGNRLAHLSKAVSALGSIIKDITLSPIYESAALLPDEAPPEWDIHYLNMAIRGETELSPQELLVSVKAIEQELGRTFTGHWGPREIDIDILAFDDTILKDNHLTIPHKYLLVRDFALIPLADIAPDWIYPLEGECHGMKAEELARNLISGLVKTDLRLLFSRR